MAWRWRGVSMSALALASCALPGAAPDQISRADMLISRLVNPELGVMVVAHRACWSEAPENSLAAIEDCVSLGVDIVELDVRETRDGHLVLMHDSTVDRTTSGSGPVADMTLAELKRLRLRKGGGGGEAVISVHRAPTLAEAFETARGRILINIDDKVNAHKKVIALAEKTAMLDHLVLNRGTPFSREEYQAMALRGRVRFMPKITQRTRALSTVAAEYQWTAPIAFELKFADESFLIEGADDIRRMHVRIWASTLSRQKAAGHVDCLALQDPEAHWGRLIDLGVNMIQTDAPASLIAFLNTRSMRRESVDASGGARRSSSAASEDQELCGNRQ
jgi:glycerophosphoryl diester phosphodiesterase